MRSRAHLFIFRASFSHFSYIRVGLAYRAEKLLSLPSLVPEGYGQGILQRRGRLRGWCSVVPRHAEDSRATNKRLVRERRRRTPRLGRRANQTSRHHREGDEW